VSDDRIFTLRVFCEVAAGRSFTRAADRLGIAKATVTKHINRIEAAYGTRLILRTPRQVQLTEAGQRLLDGALPLLDEFGELEEFVRAASDSITGEIRVGATPALGIYMAEAVKRFLQEHPATRITLTIDLGEANILAEVLDVSIRIFFAEANSGLVLFPLASTPQYVVASPGYLKGRKIPAVPSDLRDHDCLVHVRKSPTNIWRFEGPHGTESVRVGSPLRSNHGEALRAACVRGAGVLMHPAYLLEDDLKTGRLRRLMREFIPQSLSVYAVAPSRQLPARVRLFVQFLKDWFEHDPVFRSFGDDTERR
jgi:DNA-binding transcriptional LysR family regulator